MNHPLTTLAVGLLLAGSCKRAGDALPPPSQRDCYTDVNALRYDIARYWCRWGRECNRRLADEEAAFKDRWEADCLNAVQDGAWSGRSPLFWPQDPDPYLGCVDGCRAWPCIEALASLECSSDIGPQECFDMWGWTEEAKGLLNNSAPELDIRVGTCDNPVDEP